MGVPDPYPFFVGEGELMTAHSLGAHGSPRNSHVEGKNGVARYRDVVQERSGAMGEGRA